MSDRRKHVCLYCCSVGGFASAEDCATAQRRLTQFAIRIITENAGKSEKVT